MTPNTTPEQDKALEAVKAQLLAAGFEEGVILLGGRTHLVFKNIGSPKFAAITVEVANRSEWLDRIASQA